ncbi:hypothetical protein JYT72_01610 [Crocinitomix catalasitica]|nr:hypothetical protein [Crocinitomix catalasitica]
MKALIYIISLFFGVSSIYAQSDISKLNDILSGLPKGDRGQFTVSYEASLDSVGKKITIVETRYQLNSEIPDSTKGHYTVYLNDLDSARIELMDMPNEQFRLFIPCIGNYGKSDLQVKVDEEVYGEFKGNNISLGYWKDEAVRTKARALIGILKRMIGEADPKPLDIKKLVGSVEFKCSKKTYLKFEKEQKLYIPETESKLERSIIFRDKELFVMLDGEIEKSYAVERLGTERGTDRIELIIKDDDVLLIFISLNGDSVTMISKDFKIIFETELVEAQK